MTSDGVDFVIDRRPDLSLNAALPAKVSSPKSANKGRKRTNTNGSQSSEVCALCRRVYAEC